MATRITRSTVDEIAYICGFENKGSFYMLFDEDVILEMRFIEGGHVVLRTAVAQRFDETAVEYSVYDAVAEVVDYIESIMGWSGDTENLGIEN